MDYKQDIIFENYSDYIEITSSNIIFQYLDTFDLEGTSKTKQCCKPENMTKYIY